MFLFGGEKKNSKIDQTEKTKKKLKKPNCKNKPIKILKKLTGLIL